MDEVLEQWQGPDIISYTSRLLDVPLRVHKIPSSQILPDKSCDIGSICFKGITCVCPRVDQTQDPQDTIYR